jgi:hypothetical protein
VTEPSRPPGRNPRARPAKAAAALLAAALLGGCGNIIVPGNGGQFAGASGPSWPPVQADWSAPGLYLQCRGGAYYLNGHPVALAGYEPDYLQFLDGTSGAAVQVHRGGGSMIHAPGFGPWVAGPAGQWTSW